MDAGRETAIEPPFGVDADSFDLDTEMIREVQFLLQPISDYSLQTDGVLGTETRTAVQAFQAQQGLPEDGVPGPSTLLALRKELGPRRNRRLIDVRTLFTSALALDVRDRFLYVAESGLVRRYATTAAHSIPVGVSLPARILDFDIQGSRLLALRADGQLLFELDEEWNVLRELAVPVSVATARLSSNGTIAAVGPGSQGFIWHPGASSPDVLELPDRPIAVAWLGDAELAVACDSQLVRVDIHGHTLGRIEIPRPGPELEGKWTPNALSISRKGNLIALARGNLFLIETSTLALRAKVDFESPVTAVRFAADERSIAIGTLSGVLAIVDLRTARRRTAWPAHPCPIAALAYANGGTRLVSAGQDASVKTWQLETSPGDQAIAVLRSDLDHGVDALDIARDVEAFAQLMLARDLRPPLSIGIFGDWGSGKSFFIDRLTIEVERQSARALAARKEKLSCAWHSRVVQITFNA